MGASYESSCPFPLFKGGRLMDFTEILSNPLIWGLLVWLFSRIFVSNKKEEEAPKKQPSRPQNRQESQPNTRQNPRPVMTRVEQKRRKEESSSLQTVQQAYEKMKDHTIVEENSKKTKHVREKHFPKVDRQVRKNKLIVDRQKAVQGVIWSEILGSPRSKNPHYTQKRRH